ncbi:U4/U6-U5 snRNP complex subunit prp31 [Dimargaris verticillata]|uniref:U4/U6-U5 snRNP complex subunit prp31 n=1 Tax=Dimargaris verticillata TaxID=2761393 RepID=A0A9W8B016_9FUNG|nr:U4/U6-U5 snRNP complex subunit prp31 [Dimargaris verticillata]
MSLADELLADLNGLDDDFSDDADAQALDSLVAAATPVNAPEAHANPNRCSKPSNQTPAFDITDTNTVSVVAKLQASSQYQSTLTQIRQALTADSQSLATSLDPHLAATYRYEAEYELVVTASNLVTEIDEELVVLYQYVRDHYQAKFPGLESLIPNTLDYFKTVQAMENTSQVTHLDLKSFLPASVAMVVTVAASTTKGRPLPEPTLQAVMQACDMALDLNIDRQLILQFIESRMTVIAPNLTAVIGSTTAARLVGHVGGLRQLCQLAASALLVLGKARKVETGYSHIPAHKKDGFVYRSSAVQDQPVDLRTKAARMLSAKCTLAARIDLTRNYPGGDMGRQMRQDIDGKLAKLAEPLPSKKVKPLPAPLEAPKKRRGGKRARREKESHAMSELRKQQNRLVFGEAEQEADYIDEEIVGLGMIGRNSGNARAVTADQRIKATVSKKYRHLGSGSAITAPITAGTATSGLASSLAFTPAQGLELHNPTAAQQQELKDLSSRYFQSSRQMLQSKRKHTET